MVCISRWYAKTKTGVSVFPGEKDETKHGELEGRHGDCADTPGERQRGNELRVWLHRTLTLWLDKGYVSFENNARNARSRGKCQGRQSQAGSRMGKTKLGERRAGCARLESLGGSYPCRPFSRRCAMCQKYWRTHIHFLCRHSHSLLLLQFSLFLWRTFSSSFEIRSVINRAYV